MKFFVLLCIFFFGNKTCEFVLFSKRKNEQGVIKDFVMFDHEFKNRTFYLFGVKSPILKIYDPLQFYHATHVWHPSKDMIQLEGKKVCNWRGGREDKNNKRKVKSWCANCRCMPLQFAFLPSSRVLYAFYLGLIQFNFLSTHFTISSLTRKEEIVRNNRSWDCRKRWEEWNWRKSIYG